MLKIMKHRIKGRRQTWTKKSIEPNCNEESLQALPLTCLDLFPA